MGGRLWRSVLRRCQSYRWSVRSTGTAANLMVSSSGDSDGTTAKTSVRPFFKKKKRGREGGRKENAFTKEALIVVCAQRQCADGKPQY